MYEESDRARFSREWKRLVDALPFETARTRNGVRRGGDPDILPAECLWQMALGEVQVYQLGAIGRAELRRVLEKGGIVRPEETGDTAMSGSKGKVAMTIRIGSIQAAALQVIAESRGQTIEEAVNDIIKDAALELVSRQHRNKDKFVRVVQHEE